MKARTRITGSSKAAALAAAATALALSVGVAQGAPGSDATIHSISLTVPILTARSPALNCPNGTRETGGGVTATTDARGYEIQLNGPIGNVTGDVPTGWSVYIGNFFSNSDRVFKVSAICSATADTTLAVASFIVPATSQASRSVDCPAGTRVTGGGVTSGGPTADDKEAYDVQVSGPTANDGTTANTDDGDVATHWFAYVANLTSSQQTFKVFAICSSTSDATVEAQPFTITKGQAAAATATCPAGSRALGGGVGTLGATPDGANSSFSGYVENYSGPVDETGSISSTDDGDVARGFASYELNASSTDQGFKSFALCASDPSGPGQNPNGAPGGGGGGGGGTNGQAPKCAGHRATIVGTSGRDRIVGTRRADVIVALGGSDRISGGGGDDIICGGAGNDHISGGSGNDKLYGQDGKDTVSGGSGDDRASGGAGNDKVSGGSGDDNLAGGSGNDKLSGGSGTDKDSGGGGKDSCSGPDKKSSC